MTACFPPDWTPPADFCHCAPAINILGAIHPFADRLVLIGDSGVSRLYKDGLGGAYRTAKAAAGRDVRRGFGGRFRRHYLPVCQSIMSDNRIGEVAFIMTRVARRLRFVRRLLLKVTVREQDGAGKRKLLSSILWDMFSGSAPYGDIFRRMVNPGLIARLAVALPGALLPGRRRDHTEVVT